MKWHNRVGRKETSHTHVFTYICSHTYIYLHFENILIQQLNVNYPELPQNGSIINRMGQFPGGTLAKMSLEQIFGEREQYATFWISHKMAVFGPA